MTKTRAAFAVFLLLAAAAPALARPGGVFGPGWGGSRMDDPWGDQRLNSHSRYDRDDREGKVDADTFAAEDAGPALGHGAITVSTLPGTTASATDQAAYEAALIDQLVKAGYDTTVRDPQDGQRVEIRIVRDVLVPEEQKRNPVSGAMSVGTGTYGSSVGMAIALDFTKPRKALISTRLEARILDKATGKPLWEGHATIATREGSDRWNDQAIATRLAAALFDHFPKPTAGKVASR
ncbi:MAG: hypothetical protein J7494_10275 [Sphingobium sp.]|nr:hypothetical protein [Sphingobium sp.]